MILSLLVAAARGGVIGRDGGLPWRLPLDLQRFKALTMGHPIIMGRRTYDSIGRPLPGRTTIVLSRDPGFGPEGVTVVSSLDEALAAAGEAGEVFVVGGGEVYAEALSRADRVYLTRVDADVEGDTFFADPDPEQWDLAWQESHEPDERHAHGFTFTVHVRRGEGESHASPPA